MKPAKLVKLTAAQKRKKAALERIEASRALREATRKIRAAKAKLPPPPKVCDDLELRFIVEYLKDLNGSAAMLRAGITDIPKVAKVYASRYLKRPHVVLELGRRRDELMGRQELSLDRVLEELRRIGLASFGDFADWGPDGVVTVTPRDELTEEQLAAISGMKEIPGMFGTRLELELHKKVPALKELRKHLAPPADPRAPAGAGSGGGAATIVIEGGPTGLETTVTVTPARKAS